MENNRHRLSQPARKEIERYDSDNKYVDSWPSVRLMCSTLGYDRRAVIRVLKGEPRFKTVKGFTFKHKQQNETKISQDLQK